MSLYYPGCALVIPSPVCSDCPTKELGGVRSIFLKLASFSFVDITNPLEWQNAICANNVYVFPYTYGTLDMAEITSNGFGNVPEDIDSYNFTLNASEPNYEGNCSFWNKIKRSHNYQVGYRTENNVHLSTGAALILPKAPISQPLTSKVIWMIQFKFVQQDIPCPLGLPPGTFDRCISC
jgi:hypothetical protein